MPRRKNDFYPTPEWAAKELVDQLLIDYPCYGNVFVWEPCAGDGALLPQLNRLGMVWTNDINPAMNADTHMDATKADMWHPNFPRAGFVITNPPFNQALPIVQRGVEKAQYAAAFLLRLSFLEPTYERGAWLKNNPPTRLIVLPRISFTGDGKTDSVTCAWMIWDKRYAESKDVPKGIKVVEK